MIAIIHAIAIVVFVFAPLIHLVGLWAFLAALWLGWVIIGVLIVRQVLEAIEQWDDDHPYP